MPAMQTGPKWRGRLAQISETETKASEPSYSAYGETHGACICRIHVFAQHLPTS